MRSEYLPSLALTSQTKPGPNNALAVTMNSRLRVSIEEKDATSWSFRSWGMAVSLGERQEKKNALLCAIEA